MKKKGRRRRKEGEEEDEKGDEPPLDVFARFTTDERQICRQKMFSLIINKVQQGIIYRLGPFGGTFSIKLINPNQGFLTVCFALRNMVFQSTLIWSYGIDMAADQIGQRGRSLETETEFPLAADLDREAFNKGPRQSSTQKNKRDL